MDDEIEKQDSGPVESAMPPPDHDYRAFVAEVKAFIDEGHMPPSTLGKLVTGDTGWVPRLLEGRTLRYNTAARARIVMREHRARAMERAAQDG